MATLLARIVSAFRETASKGRSDACVSEKLYTDRSFVLDGTNIALLHGPRRPELRYVLAVAHHIVDNAGVVSCFFDANTRYLFRDKREEQQACFKRLTTEEPWANFFQIVPSGTQADPWILAQAKKHHCEVISNDRFKDRARAHRWIWKRRHGLLLSNDRLQLPSLNVSLELLSQPEDYLPGLCALPSAIP